MNFVIQSENCKSLAASVFAISSPNVNWHTSSYTAKFKHPFLHAFQYAHLSTTCSDIGKQGTYRNNSTLQGRNAIITLSHWASRVSASYQEPHGHGSFTSTTFQGRNNRKLTVICAYIAVLNGRDMGETSVYHQQYTNSIKSNYCPCKAAVKEITEYIKDLQRHNHAIILLLDANQTYASCYTQTGLKPFSIEWLHINTGMDDPFINLFGSRPSTTTIIPNHDLGWVLSWGIQLSSLSVLPINNPATSDHLGISIDIDIKKLFGSSNGCFSQPTQQKLTSKNIQARTKYIAYINDQWKNGKFLDRARNLLDKVIQDGHDTSSGKELQKLDHEITEAMPKGELQCSKTKRSRGP